MERMFEKVSVFVYVSSSEVTDVLSPTHAYILALDVSSTACDAEDDISCVTQ